MDSDRNSESEQPTAASEGGSDNATFLRLLSTNRHQIFGFIFTLTPNHSDAEDVFQETSIVLWNKFHQFDQQRPFLPWACGVAYNTARNFLRAAGRSRLVFSDPLLATIASERSDARECESSADRMALLQTCLSKLSDRDRKLLGQAYGGKGSVKELAQQLNRATQTIYNRLNIIRRKLVECVRISGPARESEA